MANESIVVITNSITGNNDVIKLLAAPGSLLSATSLGLKVSSGCDLIFFSVVAKSGPATIMVGMAMISPYNNVTPILAWNCATNAAGEGCGGRKPCVTDNAASIGRPIYTAGNLYW